MLSHLENGFQVDQAILSEEDRVVVSFRIFILNLYVYYHLGLYIKLILYCQVISLLSVEIL